LANNVGIIDRAYTGEIMIALILGGVLSMIGAWIGEKVQG
ncbi:MAG: hypothetical protein RJA11_1864, partial [Bacteroidota bacterium]